MVQDRAIKLTPVDYDPFADEAQPASPPALPAGLKLAPVDYDPFADEDETPPGAPLQWTQPRPESPDRFKLGHGYLGSATDFERQLGRDMISAYEWVAGANRPNRSVSEQARAANITAFAASQPGMTPTQAEEAYAAWMKEEGLGPEPSAMDLAMFAGLTLAMMAPGVAELGVALKMAKLTYPMLAKDVLNFTALSMVGGKIAEFAAKYMPWTTAAKIGEGGGAGFKALLPAYSSDAAQSFMDIAEFMALGMGAAKLTKLETRLWDKAATKVFRQVIIEKGLPERMWFSAEKIHAALNPYSKEISPAERAIIRTLGLSSGEYERAMVEGLDIIIPAERVITLVDKINWKGLKKFFGFEPYGRVIEVSRPAPARTPVEEISPADFKPSEMPPVKPAAAQEAPKGPAEGLGPGLAENAAKGRAGASGAEISAESPKPPTPSKAEAPEEFDELAAWVAESDFAQTIPVTSIAEYEQLQSAARARAAKRVPELMEARKLKALKAAEKEGAANADAVMADMPAIQAMDAAVQGGGLRREDLLRDYDQATITQLSRKRPGLIKSGGRYRPDEFAVEHGFEGGTDEMIEAMLDTPTRKAARLKAAEQARQALEEAWTEEAADISLETLEQEIKILNEMLGKKPHVARGIKKVIREETGQTRSDRLVSEADSLKEAFKKAERASRVAWREGRREVVLQQKEIQKAHIARIRDLYRIRDEIRTIEKALGRDIRHASIPFEYRDQLTDFLKPFVKIPRTFMGQEPNKPLAVFLREKADAGEEGAQIALSRLERLGGWDKGHTLHELTIEQIEEVKAISDALVHLGRTEKRLLKIADKQSLEGAVSDVTRAIRRTHRAVTPEWIGVPTANQRRLKPLAALWGKYQEIMAGRVKIEIYCRALDGWEDMGTIWRKLFRPVAKSEDAESLLGSAKTEELRAAFDRVLDRQVRPVYPGPASPTRADWQAMGPGWAEIMLPDHEPSPGVLAALDRGRRASAWANQKYLDPDLPQVLQWKRGAYRPQPLDKETIVMVALNSGTEGNRAALRTGNNWTDADIDKIVSLLTEDEWALVENIWNIIDSLFPALAEVYTQLTGARLTKVEGRYFPLIFDRALSWIMDAKQAEANAKDFFKTIYTKATPRDNMTKERIGGKYPPLLKFSVIDQHVRDVAHSITHAETLRDVGRIVNHDAFRSTVSGTENFGERVWRQFNPWLQEIARPRRETINEIEGVARWARKNATVVNMGLKASVAMLQPLAAFQAVPQLGEGAMARGFVKFYTNPWAMRDFIIEKSPMMRFRAQQFDRELNQLFNRFDASLFSRSQEFKQAAFGVISMMDKSATYPVWMAAYEKGLFRYAGDDAMAADFADMIVRTTQGTGMPKDLAGWQRGSELAKALTMFYSFWSVYANQMYELGFRRKMGDVTFLEWFKAHAWLTLVPTFIGFVMRERRLPTSKEALAELAAYRLSGLPVVRSFSGTLFHGFDLQLSPAGRGGQALVDLANAVTKANVKDRGQKIVKAGASVIGYGAGLPSAQALITYQGILDLMSGKSEDPTRLLFRESRKPNDE